MAKKRRAANPVYYITRHPFLARLTGSVSRGFRAKTYAAAKKKAQRLSDKTGKDYYVYGPRGNEPRLRVNPSAGTILKKLARGVKAEWVALRTVGRRKQLLIKTK